jgi:hypothetical protein
LLLVAGTVAYLGFETFKPKKGGEAPTIGSIIIFAIFVAFFVYIVYKTLAFETALDTQLAKIFASKEVSTQVVEIYEEETGQNSSVGKTTDDSADPTVNDEFHKEIKFKFYSLDNPKDDSYSAAYIQEVHEVEEYYYLVLTKQYVLMISKNPADLVEGTQEDLKYFISELAATRKFVQFLGKIYRRPITFVHSYVAPGAFEAAEEVVENGSTEFAKIESEETKNENISTVDDKKNSEE